MSKPYITANQVKTAELKSVDFGPFTLYEVPFSESNGEWSESAYCDVVCVFPEKPAWTLLIDPDGTWRECPAGWSSPPKE